MDTNPGKLAFETDWQYSPAPESTDHVQIDDQYGLFIGGEFVAAKSGQSFETINPATEQVLAKVAEAGRISIATRRSARAASE